MIFIYTAVLNQLLVQLNNNSQQINNKMLNKHKIIKTEPTTQRVQRRKLTGTRKDVKWFKDQLMWAEASSHSDHFLVLVEEAEPARCDTVSRITTTSFDTCRRWSLTSPSETQVTWSLCSGGFQRAVTALSSTRPPVFLLCCCLLCSSETRWSNSSWLQAAMFETYWTTWWESVWVECVSVSQRVSCLNSFCFSGLENVVVGSKNRP